MKGDCLALGWAERWKMRMQITVWVLLFTLRVLCWGGQQSTNVTFFREVMSVPGVCVHISCPLTNCGSKNVTGGRWTKCPYDECQNCSARINDSGGNSTVEDINSSLSEDNCSMIIDVVKKEDAGCYQFNGQLNSSVKISIQEKPVISDLSLTDGQEATLSCSAPDPCPSARPHISLWLQKTGKNMTSTKNVSENWTQSNGILTSTLTFTPSFELHDTEVVCVVHYGNDTTINTTKALSSPPQMLETHCVRLDEDLDCRCVCRGVPLPHVTWQKNFILNSQRHLIQGHVINFTMNSTISLHRPRFQMLPGVMECVCENDAGTVNTTLNITKGIIKEDKGANNDNKIKLDLRIILIILVVSASTAVVISVALCFVGISKRCRAIKAVDEGVSMEAVNSQHEQTDTNHKEADEHTPLQRKPVAEAGNGVMEEMEREDTPGEHRNSERDEAAGGERATDVDYASIDYSLLQARGATAQETAREETEYAEIQIKKQNAEEGEILQDGADQTETSIPEDEEQNQEQQEEEEVEV